MRHARFAAEAALLLAALLYGVTFPLVHDALDDITPFAYLVGRFGIALLFVAPAAWIAARGMRDRRLLWRAGAIAGVLLFGGYATQTVGLQYTTPSTSAFITGLYVVLTPVVEAVVYRRTPERAVWVGIVLATIGLYLLTGADVHLGRGELLTLACALLFAGHIVYLGAYARRLPPAAFTGMQVGMVAVLSLPAAAEQGVGTLTALAVFAVIFTGVGCSAIALPLQMWGTAPHPGRARGVDPPGGTRVRRHRGLRQRRTPRAGAARRRRDHPRGHRGVGARVRRRARHVAARGGGRVTTTRTQVGIVEWAPAGGRRTRSRAVVGRRARGSGRRGGGAGGEDRARPARASARMARRAVEERRPGAPGRRTRSRRLRRPRARRGTSKAVQARLEDGYRAWRAEASVIAEAPILRVLELIARDHEAC